MQCLFFSIIWEVKIFFVKSTTYLVMFLTKMLLSRKKRMRVISVISSEWCDIRCMHDNFLRKFLDWFLSIWRNFFRLLDKRLRAQQKFCIWFDEKHYMCHILWLVLRIFCIYCDKKWDLIKYFFQIPGPFCTKSRFKHSASNFRRI